MPLKPIFLCYSRKDSEFVMRVATDLKKNGIKFWLDQLDIKIGSHWDLSIEKALDAANSMIVFLSPASIFSRNVLNEISYALENEKSVIPVVISECKSPLQLIRMQRIDFTADYQKGVNQLINRLDNDITNKQQANNTTAKKVVLQAKTTVGKKNRKVFTEAKNAVVDAKISIGKYYQGGIIFYIDASGKHGLVVSTRDIGEAEWSKDGHRSISDPVGQETKIGSGKINTDQIVHRLGRGDYAAKLCADSKLKGYAHWYLPSKDELDQIYKNRKLVGDFSDGYYWSSSYVYHDLAWSQLFIGGHKSKRSTYNAYYVRAVRSF